MWWQNIGDCDIRAIKTPQEALDGLCFAQERLLRRLERAGVQGEFGPKLNPEQGGRLLACASGRTKKRRLQTRNRPQSRLVMTNWLSHGSNERI